MIYIKKRITSNFAIDKDNLQEAIRRANKDQEYETFQNSYSIPVLNLPNKFRNWVAGQTRYNSGAGLLGGGLATVASTYTGVLPVSQILGLPYDLVKYIKDDQEKYHPKADRVDKMNEKLKSEIQKRLPDVNFKGIKFTPKEKNWLINKANEHYLDLTD